MKRILLITVALLSISVCTYARQPQKGYRGFIDWTNDVRSMEGFFTRYTILYTGLSTSHGYQWNPWLFTGAGLNLEYHHGTGSGIASAFFQGRTDLKFGKFTPFGDVRLGYNFSEDGGVYFSPNIGYRFNWGRKVGVNLGVGITLITYKLPIYEITCEPEADYTYCDGHYIGKKLWSSVMFSFKVGIDF